MLIVRFSSLAPNNPHCLTQQSNNNPFLKFAFLCSYLIFIKQHI